MRVVQNKPHAADKPADAKTAEPIEDKDEATGEDVEETTSDDDKKPKLMLSGAPVQVSGLCLGYISFNTKNNSLSLTFSGKS